MPGDPARGMTPEELSTGAFGRLTPEEKQAQEALARRWWDDLTPEAQEYHRAHLRELVEELKKALKPGPVPADD